MVISMGRAFFLLTGCGVMAERLMLCRPDDSLQAENQGGYMVAVESQGDYNALRVSWPVTRRINPGAGGAAKRGEIREFSKKSRKRLLDKMARLKYSKTTIFITLTTGAVLGEDEIKNAFSKLIKRLNRCFPRQVAGLWRMEYQQRGAPHLHLLLFGLPFLPKERLCAMWGACVREARPFTRIEKIELPAVACMRHLRRVNSHFRTDALIECGTFQLLVMSGGGENVGKIMLDILQDQAQ